MKTFLLSFLGGLAALIVFFVLLPLAIVMTLLPDGTEAPVASKTVLTLDLREAAPDQPSSTSVGALFNEVSFVEILLRLNAAAKDPNVKGVFVRAPEFDLGSSRAEELRAAFKRIQANKKFVIAHSQGFIASGPSSYRAVAGVDELWIQPGSSFEAPGLSFEQLYLGDLFQKLKVTPEIEQFLEYKSAAEIYKRNSYSEASEEAMTALGTSVWNASIADIAEDRKLPADQVRTLLEASPYTAERSVELKFADKLGWPEDAQDAAKERADGELVWIGDYHPSVKAGKAKIALVGGEGEIVTGAGDGGLLGGASASFGSDRVAEQLLELLEEDDIKAVVFRVDSPGGSATASDQVWRAVKRLQEKGKKVVVSMGSLAASGGYYVSAGADAIVANKSTITGSIGVFGGKFAIADGLRTIGVSPDDIRIGGEYASTYSTEKLTNYQRSKLVEQLASTYDRFTSLVAEGRKLSKDRVAEIAKGRIWSGEDAKQLGLVDETGDLMVAIDKARELAGYKSEDGVDVRLRIPRASPFEMLKGAFATARVAIANPRVVEVMSALAGDRRSAAAMREVLAVTERRGTQVYAPPIIER